MSVRLSIKSVGPSSPNEITFKSPFSLRPRFHGNFLYAQRGCRLDMFRIVYKVDFFIKYLYMILLMTSSTL